MVNIPFFGKKKKETKFRVPAVERVATLSSQGFSEPEIIKTLRDEGYSPMEVDKAMKTALKSATTPSPISHGQSPIQPEQTSEIQGTVGQLKPPFLGPSESSDFMFNKEPELPLIPEPPGLGPKESISQKPSQQKPQPAGEGERKELEEIAESIVEEKWSIFEKEINELNNRLNKMDSKIYNLENTINQIKGVEKSEIEEIKKSINTYRESISEVSARMESIERAMKDSLTPMLQTLRSLSDTIKELKKR